MLALLYVFGINQLGRAMQYLGAVAGRMDSIVGVLLRGCLHTHLGWPIQLDGYTYRVCLGCGIKRLFDEDALACYGEYGYDLQQLAAEWRLSRERESSRGLAGAVLHQQRH